VGVSGSEPVVSRYEVQSIWRQTNATFSSRIWRFEVGIPFVSPCRHLQRQSVEQPIRNRIKNVIISISVLTWW
jgi:hypothetical protein